MYRSALIFILYVAAFCDVFAKKTLDLSINNSAIYRTKGVLLSAMPEDIALGQKNAKVHVVVFDSYSCIHCARFYAEIFPILEEDYIKSGKVYFINKEFPLDQYAVFATKAVQCSADKLSALQKVYTNQSQWLSSNSYQEDLLAMTGADRSCIEKYDEKSAQKQTFEYTKVLGIKGTPAIFVNGKYLEKLSKKNLLSEIESGLK